MTSDADLAADLAERAGQLLLAIRADATVTGDRLGAVGDGAADRLILDGLHAARPGDGILSEETRCDGTRLARSRVWIVDPLDGTREYAEGRGDWAVHVALAVDGVAVAGAVALPVDALVCRSDRPVPPAAPREGLRMVVSRSRPPDLAREVADRLGAALVTMGSAGAKAMAVVRGEADIYLHLGGQREWDSAAPVAVAAAHGFHCSRIDGAPLRYNRRDVWVPDLLICRADLAAPTLAALAALA